MSREEKVAGTKCRAAFSSRDIFCLLANLNSNEEEINILGENSDDESGRRDTEHNLGTGPDIHPVDETTT